MSSPKDTTCVVCLVGLVKLPPDNRESGDNQGSGVEPDLPVGDTRGVPGTPEGCHSSQGVATCFQHMLLQRLTCDYQEVALMVYPGIPLV